jgi:hypothetical protein
MLIAALVIGLLFAYYLGFRPGMYAAGASAALFFVATAVPNWALWSYAIVGVGVLAVCTIGPRVQKPSHKQRFMGLGRDLLKRGFKLLRRK